LQRDDDATAVEHQAGDGDPALAGGQPCHGYGQACRGEHQAPRRRAHDVLDHPGAKHRGPQGEQGAQHGEPDPAEEVGVHVRCVQRRVPVVGERVHCKERAEGDAGDEREAGRDVVLHRSGEPAHQGVAGDPQQ
jgi:hypothetical protein